MVVIGVGLTPVAAVPTPTEFRLVLPIKCAVGTSCFIQNYVDLDPSPASRDFMCGSRTYDDHNGIDFRLRSMDEQRAGVAVLAAAEGTVLRLRDSVPDVSVADRRAGAVANVECGNGVVIRHRDGWETQYCHMAKNSISVAQGQKVAAGTQLGQVGLSGNTEYPHLHFTVRHRNSVVDPFAPQATNSNCGRSSGDDMWAASTRLSGAYKAGEVINSGFAAGPVTMADVTEHGSRQPVQPTASAPALVGFAQAIGLKRGDVQQLTITAPGGSIVADSLSEPLDRDKAQTLVFAGHKRKRPSWPAGEYRGRYVVQRQGQAVLRHAFNVVVRAHWGSPKSRQSPFPRKI